MQYYVFEITFIFSSPYDYTYFVVNFHLRTLNCPNSPSFCGLKSNIPTHEITLVNGDVVIFYDYITTGESRDLQKVLLEKGKFNSATGQIEDLPLSTFLESQDKAASFVIKEIKLKGYTI